MGGWFVIRINVRKKSEFFGIVTEARPADDEAKIFGGDPEKTNWLFGEEEAQRSVELFSKENDKRSLC